MDKCREEFEKIPYVKAILEGVHSSIVWFGEGKYHTSFFGFDGAVNRLNGAWVVYQNQQAKVEELKASYHGEMIGHEVHLKKIKQERDELQTLYTQQGINMFKLQKRLDTALKLMQKPLIVGEPAKYVCARFKEIEQALKGEGQ